MPYTTTLPYKHFNRTKGTLRITYLGNGKKIVENLLEKPLVVNSKSLAGRWDRMALRMRRRSSVTIGFIVPKGEYDLYPSDTHTLNPDPHKEI